MRGATLTCSDCNDLSFCNECFVETHRKPIKALCTELTGSQCFRQRRLNPAHRHSPPRPLRLLQKRPRIRNSVNKGEIERRTAQEEEAGILAAWSHWSKRRILVTWPVTARTKLAHRPLRRRHRCCAPTRIEIRHACMHVLAGCERTSILESAASFCQKQEQTDEKCCWNRTDGKDKTPGISGHEAHVESLNKRSEWLCWEC